tara:strand:+ start:2667 stop:3704 length:1038 start_codon:yes stop_codon:yes gene_type:complete
LSTGQRQGYVEIPTVKFFFKVFIPILLLVGGLLYLSFQPAVLTWHDAAPIDIENSAPVDGVRIAAIRTGAIHSRAALAYRGGSFKEEREFIVGAILVLHPRGNILIDTGFGTDLDQHAQFSPIILRATTQYSKGRTVAQQLADAGFPISQIRQILLTHAHWDHVSGIPDLVGPSVLTTRAEAAFINSDNSAMDLMRSFGRVPITPINYRDGPYLGFETSQNLYDDGSIVIVPAPGHTPGSVIVFVNTEDAKRYAFVGDLVWQREGIEIPAERPMLSRLLVDIVGSEVRQNIVHMHRLMKRMPELVVVPAHDSRVWASLPQFPEALKKSADEKAKPHNKLESSPSK